MALYTAEAVVAGVKNFGDADKIVTFFTKERGIVRAVAFGCRRPRSPLAGAMQMFAYLDVQLAEGRSLDTVRSATVRRHGRRIIEDLGTMAYGTFVAEFLRDFLPEGQPEEGMFPKVLQILEAFEMRNPRVTALAAVLQLLEYTGLQLSLDRCVHSGKPISGDAFFSLHEGGALAPGYQTSDAVPYPAELRELMTGLRGLDWKQAGGVRISAKYLMQAERLVLTYLQETLGHPMKSLAFIQQLA